MEEKLSKALKLHEEGNLNEAKKIYIDILENIPEQSDAALRIFTLIAYIEKAHNNFDEAVKLFNKVITINPDYANLYKELADIYYLKKNNTQKTIECYEKYLSYFPDDEDAKSCLGLAYLKSKNFPKGWEYFESRPQKQPAILSRVEASNGLLNSKPLWNGEDIKNKTVFVYYDAGYGDTIMFSRFLTMFKGKCKNLIFKPQKSLARVFKDSNFDFEIIEDEPENGLKYDYHCTLMSLPYLLNIKEEKDIPLSQGYLKASPQKIEDFRKKYFDNDEFKIGVKWQGKITNCTEKTIPIEAFFKLFDIPNTKFYSLQKESNGELKKAQKYGIIDLSEEMKDFSDTAAIIENLNLVICNDTSISHLAGALGKSCWTLLPFVQDWRWSDDTSYCYWYKSLKLFKQNNTGDWNALMENCYKELNMKGGQS